MNAEEKARAYDEMVQRVKELHEAGNALTKKQMEIVLPELAESEDEKIRKELIDQVQYIIPEEGEYDEEGLILPNYHERINRYKAYLEKQKEPPTNEAILKALDKYEKCVADAITKYEQKEPNYTKRNALFDKCVENCDPEIMKRVSDEIDAMLEKEQKPVEIHIDNPNIEKFDPNVKVTTSDSSAGRAVNVESLKDTEQEPVQSRERILYQLFQSGLITLSDYLYLNKEQKPVEKQDYSGLNELERIIHRGFLSAGVENVPVTIIKETAQECLTQMQSAEWSTEDEEMYARVVRRYTDYEGVILKTKEESVADKMLNAMAQEEIWLKSLRPSWKPSEEQMNALQCAIVFMEIRKASDYDISPLKSLYEQLKKL